MLNLYITFSVVISLVCSICIAYTTVSLVYKLIERIKK